jgi:hypothetical protein
MEKSHVEQVISSSSNSNNDDIDHVREVRGRGKPKLSEEETKRRQDDSARHKKPCGLSCKPREPTQAKKCSMDSFVINPIKKR